MNKKMTGKTPKRLIWRIIVSALEGVAEFSSEKPSKPRYPALLAQHLYDENLISDAEYGKSVFRGD